MKDNVPRGTRHNNHRYNRFAVNGKSSIARGCCSSPHKAGFMGAPQNLTVLQKYFLLLFYLIEKAHSLRYASLPP